MHAQHFPRHLCVCGSLRDGKQHELECSWWHYILHEYIAHELCDSPRSNIDHWVMSTPTDHSHEQRRQQHAGATSRAAATSFVLCPTSKNVLPLLLLLPLRLRRFLHLRMVSWQCVCVWNCGWLNAVYTIYIV